MILAELKKRSGEDPFVDRAFPLQARLVEDPERFHAWQATRRGAKSNTFARRMLKKVTQKKCNALYLALTLDSAKAILWEVVEELLRKSGRDYTSDKNRGTFTLDNGSFIKFAGLDSNYKEMRKILGQKFAIVGIDECGSMTQDMETIVNQMITPALTDEMGDLILLGTAENIPGTYFEKVTKEEIKGFKVEIWDTYQNPYMARNWDSEIKRILAANPLAANASWFKTHYLNVWCTSDELKVYQIAPFNLLSDLRPKKRPRHVIGVDLGFNDDTAFTVATYFEGDPTLYFDFAHKQPGMDITDVANFVKGLQGKYHNATVIVDGANKQGVEEIRNRHKIGLISAEKQDKSTFMRILADDLKQSRVQLVEPRCQALLKELEQLMWLKDEDVEDPRCQNHLCDAFLYAWRHARSYIEQVEVTPWMDPDQKQKLEEQKEAQKAREERELMSFLY